MEKQIGERIAIPADQMLGTPATTATILEVHDAAYLVEYDDCDGTGTVNENGTAVHNF